MDLINHKLMIFISMNLKKIIKEEMDEFDWIRNENTIDAKELRKLVLEMGTETIPFTHVIGNLDLTKTKIRDLGKLEYVSGYLNLQHTPIQSLGNLKEVGGNLYFLSPNIESLENLEKVGGDLYLDRSNIRSLGNLKEVGGILVLTDTPLSKKYSEEEIRRMVDIDGHIYL